jgi:hypothetical protein
MRHVGALIAILGGCAPGIVGDGGLRIEPGQTVVDVDPTLGETRVQLRAYLRADGADVDVTRDVTWSAETVGAPGALGAIANDGVFVTTGVGGHATIEAALDDVSASAALTLRLRATMYVGGADLASPGRFDAATVDATRAVDIEYPEPGVVVPGNAGPIEVQWSQVGADDLHRVRFSASDVLDVVAYTTNRELAWPDELWTKLAATAADAPLSITVTSVAADGTAHASPERQLTITSEQLALDPIVTHGFAGRPRATNPANQTEWFLPTAADGQCAGCHRFSRDGKRVAFLRRNAGAPSLSINEYGALAYDASTARYAQTMAPVTGSYAGQATFNPREATSPPAMLLARPDPARDTTLALVDPTTGAVVPSNLATALASGAATGKAIVHPEWSPTGDFIVFTTYDPAYELIFGGAPFASLVQATVSYDAQTQAFTFGTPEILVAPSSMQSIFGATISGDGKTVAFVRGRMEQTTNCGTPSSCVADRHIVIIRRDMPSTPFELAASHAPAGLDWKSTSPSWAPREGARYAWIVYTSRRPYGHLFVPTGAFPNSHLWITAVDRDELAAGVANPTRTPFFVRGQRLDDTYIFPQWTTAP